MAISFVIYFPTYLFTMNKTNTIDNKTGRVALSKKGDNTILQKGVKKSQSFRLTSILYSTNGQIIEFKTLKTVILRRSQDI